MRGRLRNPSNRFPRERGMGETIVSQRRLRFGSIGLGTSDSPNDADLHGQEPMPAECAVLARKCAEAASRTRKAVLEKSASHVPPTQSPTTMVAGSLGSKVSAEGTRIASSWNYLHHSHCV